MNRLIYVLLLLSGSDVIAAPAEIAHPRQRTLVVEGAEMSLKAPVFLESLASAVNPFTLNPARGGTSGNEADNAARAAALASNKTLLLALADQLEPKGTFVIGGEPIVLIGQKKLKVGDRLSISFEGSLYEVEITAIESTKFSIRYKNEELTRPIVTTKSGK